MIELKALKKLRYPRGGPDGKEYQPGQTFTVFSERDAKALTLIRSAEHVRADSPTDLPKAAAEPPRQAAPVKDLAALRGDYETKVGKRPFSGWPAEELIGRMEAHQAGRTYERRDMRARD